ncbi:unnamed protein product, partial [Prorocentrum cordatum]
FRPHCSELLPSISRGVLWFRRCDSTFSAGQAPMGSKGHSRDRRDARRGRDCSGVGWRGHREQRVENLRRQLARADPELADVHREKIFTCRQKVRCAMGQLLVEAMKSTLEDVLKDMRGMVESGRSPRGCCFPPAPPDGRAEGGRGAWRSKIT